MKYLIVKLTNHLGNKYGYGLRTFLIALVFAIIIFVLGANNFHYKR